MASMAAVWTHTAASASASEPDAVISLPGPPLRQSGTSAGTSISPAPWRVDIMQDHRASAAWPAAKRANAARASSPPASASSVARSIAMPSIATAATSATDAACPAAIGSRAPSACLRSRERTPWAAANSQPVAGFSPCRAPAAATATHGHTLDMARSPAQACTWQQAGVAEAETAAGAFSYRSWWRTQDMPSAGPSSCRPLGVRSSKA